MCYDHMVVVLHNDMACWISDHIGFDILATRANSVFPWRKFK